MVQFELAIIEDGSSRAEPVFRRSEDLPQQIVAGGPSARWKKRGLRDDFGSEFNPN